MRSARLIATLFFALLFVAIAFAQTAQKPARSSSLEKAITGVLNEQVTAWNAHDLEKFMAGYWHSPELTFFSGGEKSAGWQAALDRYRKRYQGEGHEMGKLDFSDLVVEPLGSDAAFARGAWHLTMPDGKTPHGLFTLVFRKFSEGWKIIHDHTSASE